MGQHLLVKQYFQNHTNMSKVNLYKILITMLKVTNDPKLIELIGMLKKEVDELK